MRKVRLTKRQRAARRQAFHERLAIAARASRVQGGPLRTSYSMLPVGKPRVQWGLNRDLVKRSKAIDLDFWHSGVRAE